MGTGTNHPHVHPVEQPYGGGYMVPATRAWPRTDENALPTCVRVPLDVNGDGTTDHVATVRVCFADLDGDGRFERDVDGIVLDPCSVERVERSIRLGFSEVHWQAAVRLAASFL